MNVLPSLGTRRLTPHLLHHRQLTSSSCSGQALAGLDFETPGMRNMQVRLGKPVADTFHESVERKMIALLEGQEVRPRRQCAVLSHNVCAANTPDRLTSRGSGAAAAYRRDERDAACTCERAEPLHSGGFQVRGDARAQASSLRLQSQDAGNTTQWVRTCTRSMSVRTEHTANDQHIDISTPVPML